MSSPYDLNLTRLIVSSNINPMVVAFLESIKYTGHLFPIALLRVYMGYFYLNSALDLFSGGILRDPMVAEMGRNGIIVGTMPPWYLDFIQNVFIPHAHYFAYLILIIEFATATSYLLGYMVRPLSTLAALLCLHFIVLSGSGPEIVQLKTFIVIHITLAWLGAGRCLGLDYFFYKRHRGIWW